MRTRRLTGRLVRLGTISVSALVVAGLTAGGAQADPADAPAPPSIQPARILPLPPELDPGFYYPPADVVAAAAPGEII
ncbi:lipase family protein, partial [Nocardia sp. NPDC004722]